LSTPQAPGNPGTLTILAASGGNYWTLALTAAFGKRYLARSFEDRQRAIFQFPYISCRHR